MARKLGLFYELRLRILDYNVWRSAHQQDRDQKGLYDRGCSDALDRLWLLREGSVRRDMVSHVQQGEQSDPLLQSSVTFLTPSKIVDGFAGGFLYVAETTAMLSYPDHNDRGLFLGIWSAMRNSGSIIGGAINFSTNYSSSGGGGIAWSTYLVFVGFGES